MHDGLVNLCNVEKAVEAVVRLGPDSLDRFSDIEPVLADYVDDSVTRIAGKMVRAGCDDSVVRGVSSELIATTLIALEALRGGHYDLWESESSVPLDSHGSEEGQDD